MNLKDIFEMYDNGVLNVEFDKCYMQRASIGGTEINTDQAHAVCINLGWVEYILHPFVIIEKTYKFFKGIRNAMKKSEAWQYIDVTFRNVSSSRSYGKTFDRINVVYSRGSENDFSVTVIYNMPGSKAKYEIYRPMESTPIARCNTLRQVGDFINSMI